MTRPQGERLKLRLLSCTKQRKAHSVLSSPAVGDCFGPLTLLLTRPHCSRDVSTLFLSENILRMLKDSEFGETQNQQQADILENALNIRREGKEEVDEGAGVCTEVGNRLLRLFLTFSRESSHPDSPAALTLYICSRQGKKANM